MSTSSSQQSWAALTLGALGIVYGDIGTSPLYALRESLSGMPIDATSVLGVLSLIFWTLILIISVKYLWLVFKADNQGEGGILALMALLHNKQHSRAITSKIIVLVGIFGAGLMLGDGMLTPAISVLSAVEGINVVYPALSDWVLPISGLILLVLFFFQSVGTEKIGYLFGPVIFIWFCTIGFHGFKQITANPIVLQAINPYHAWHFFSVMGWRGYACLGGIFLVVTGGEALYADLGHFGKRPIRKSWYAVALPGLLLNYFGQGAYLIDHPEGISNPFFLIAIPGFALPLLIIATAATIIASQAVISATFSMARQAVLLGFYPRMHIIQTSSTEIGQIYIPQMNVLLALGTMILIFSFQSSSALAHAYGIAVNLEMLLTTLLIAHAAEIIWGWHRASVLFIFMFFILIDLLFFGANIQKIETGGWVPIIFAMFCSFMMLTWNKGMEYVRQKYYMKKNHITKLLKLLHHKRFNKLANTTAIYITDIYDNSGGSFLNFLKLSLALPEHVVIVNYFVKNIPVVNDEDRFEIKRLDDNIYHMTLYYGFKEFISIPDALRMANSRRILPFVLNINRTVYLVEILNILASTHKKTLWFAWQEQLFAFLMRNYSANLNIEFYQLPYHKTIAIGTYCEM